MLDAAEEIDFVLGHAYSMKAIHSGNSKNDRIDSHELAALLRGGTFPVAYVYPRKMRATRDLLRRRPHFVHKRAELLAHIQNSNTQYNLEPLEGRLAAPGNREGLLRSAACFLGGNPKGQRLLARHEEEHGKGKAMGVLAAKLVRAVYYMLKSKEPFDLNRFTAA